MRNRKIIVAVIGVLAVVTVVSSLTVFVPMARRYLRESKYIEQLRSGDMDTKKHAAEQLVAMRSVRSVPVLLDLIREFDTATWLIVTLKDIGPAGVAVLVRGLDDESENVRCGAALALGDMQATSAVRSLARNFSDGTDRSRICAGVALGHLAEDALPALPVVVGTLSDSDDEVRSCAVGILRRIGPAAREAGPSLIPLLKDGNARVRFAAAVALLAVGYRPLPVSELARVIREDREGALKNASETYRKEVEDLIERAGSQSRPR